MKSPSLSGKEKTLDEINNWYKDQLSALIIYRSQIIAKIENEENIREDKFSYLSIDEILDYFQESIKELEILTTFNVIAATEAKLKIDLEKEVKIEKAVK